MKKYALSLIIMIIPFLASAQDWDVEFGKVYKGYRYNELFRKYNDLLRKDLSTSFLGLNQDYYYLNYESKKDNEILQFDFNHNLINAILIGENPEGEKLEPEYMMKTVDDTYLISSYYNKKNSQESIYATRLNEDGSLEKVEEPIFSYSIPSLSNSGYANTDVSGYAFSLDSSKIVFAMAGDYEVKRKGGNETYQIFVFDNDFNLLWKKDITLPDVDKKIKIQQFSVTNQGEVYFLAKSKEKFTRKNRWIPKGDFFTIRVKEEEIIINTLKLKEAYPISVTVFWEDNVLYAAGIYTNGWKESSGADGTFMMKFDEDDSLLFYEKYPFDRSIKRYLVPNRQKQKEQEFFNFEIDDLLIDYKNGYFIFAAENRYTSKFYNNISEDIIVSKFSFDGDLEWNYHKHKKFAGAGSTYGLSHGNGNIYLIFNTNKTTNEQNRIQHNVRPNRTSSYTDIVKINTKGEVELEDTIFHSRELKIPFYPIYSRRINNQKVLLLFRGEETKFQYGTLKFR